MGRQLAAFSRQRAVPINLISIVNGRQKEPEIGFHARYRYKDNVPPVPCIPRIAEMPLSTPASIYADSFPCGIVQPRRGPGRVVAQVKLPFAIERSSAFAQPLNDQGRGRRFFCGVYELIRSFTGAGAPLCVTARPASSRYPGSFFLVAGWPHVILIWICRLTHWRQTRFYPTLKEIHVERIAQFSDAPL
jgi:hypothetical protein